MPNTEKHHGHPDAAEAPGPRFDSPVWRAGDALVGLLARAGIGPIHLLTTRGRVTGQPHTKPVVPVVHDGRRWLVAPYGVVGWVRNARADGTVELRHGRTRRRYEVREATRDEAGPVLKRYLAVATKARVRVEVDHDAPVADFVAVAGRYPVLELVPPAEPAEPHNR
ncbi:MAG: nitroreductase family deazaflavin-dependent oxidoreductase [Actinomycetota bacterium]|nr:nitroreductase family deazaflavin-dependent oxidoreductase [Actinomycetota bacterium]